MVPFVMIDRPTFEAHFRSVYIMYKLDVETTHTPDRTVITTVRVTRVSWT